jgi:NADH-quinone oxidoreductase subunit N
MNNQFFTAYDALYQLPLFIFIFTGLVLVLAEAFTHGRSRAFLMPITVAGCAAAFIAALVLFRKLGSGPQPPPLMKGMLIADRYAYFFIMLFSAAAAFTALITPDHQREHRWENGEFYGILMLSTAGMAIIAMSADLVSLFIGIETMSIGVYVLTASRWRSRRSAEAAMKYFLMGAFATGFLLYGIALVYGATGTTNMIVMSVTIGKLTSSPLLLIGMFMMVMAFCFKVAAAPFHMWAPDAYEGAPTPVTAYMAAAVKAAAFAAILRVLVGTFGGDVLPVGRLGWGGILAIVAAATMTIGNIAALRQENIKRMLAYSSISHAGVILVGVVAAGVGSQAIGQSAVMYYVMAYAVTTLGAFAVVVWIGRRGRERVLIEDWNGLAGTHPGAALAMTVFMLALGGIPPTAGFFGKFYVFKAAMHAHDQLLWLVVVGVINSVISIFYYLRVVTAMYFKPAADEFQPLRSGAVIFVMAVCALLAIEMGVMPGFWLGLTN